LPSGSYCTRACTRRAHQRQIARSRAEVFRLLGNRCACRGCTWHTGICTVIEPTLFEVDHIHNHGHRVRNTRRDGTCAKDFPANWSRYLREIRANPTGHGNQLLCANCHRAVTVARRHSVDTFTNGLQMPPES